MQTLVPIAANGGKDPEVIDAAACTFLHEGRTADFRCKCVSAGAVMQEQSFIAGAITLDCCKRSNGSSEPSLTDAIDCTDGSDMRQTVFRGAYGCLNQRRKSCLSIEACRPQSQAMPTICCVFSLVFQFLPSWLTTLYLSYNNKLPTFAALRSHSYHTLRNRWIQNDI